VRLAPPISPTRPKSRCAPLPPIVSEHFIDYLVNPMGPPPHQDGDYNQEQGHEDDPVARKCVKDDASVLKKLIQSRRPGHTNEVEVTLKNFYNYNYVGQISVGNPPQVFNTIFDSGSTNFWTLSTLAGSPRVCNNVNNAFNPKLSTSYSPTNLACEVVFGSGSLQGFFAKDDVTIGVHGMGPDGVIRDKIVVKN
jgi:hypothetical protein